MLMLLRFMYFPFSILRIYLIDLMLHSSQILVLIQVSISSSALSSYISPLWRVSPSSLWPFRSRRLIVYGQDGRNHPSRFVGALLNWGKTLLIKLAVGVPDDLRGAVYLKDLVLVDGSLLVIDIKASFQRCFHILVLW